MASRFEKFSERARKVLTLAQEEAQRFNHNYIGTEHILLGLVREGEGVAAKVLANLGVELPKVRSAVEFIIGRGERTSSGEIGLTPRAKKVIELAVDEARRLNHHYIGTEHILLGLVKEEEGVAARVLINMGVSLPKMRSAVEYVIGPGEKVTTAGTGLTTRAKRVIELAIDEARQMGHNYIGTEHLLLGLLREADGVAAGVLDSFSVTLEKARA